MKSRVPVLSKARSNRQSRNRRNQALFNSVLVAFTGRTTKAAEGVIDDSGTIGGACTRRLNRQGLEDDGLMPARSTTMIATLELMPKAVDLILARINTTRSHGDLRGRLEGVCANERLHLALSWWNAQITGPFGSRWPFDDAGALANG